MRQYHTTVLLQETIDYLRIEKEKRYIDATLGGGGHTGDILRLGGNVLGIDRDQDALSYVVENFTSEIAEKKLITAHGNFINIRKIAQEHGFGPISGILFDLGVSGHQFDTAERGFSFQADAPLDMRMDKTLSVSAKELVNGMTEKELADLFFHYGEERNSRRIAGAIITARLQQPIVTTSELGALIKRVSPGKFGDPVHPATRTFQALRIAVNDELRSIESALPEALSLLEPGGRLAVISFHSLEDRIVKRMFLAFEKEGRGEILTKKPVTGTEAEVRHNNRARSAKLRVFQNK